MSPTQRSLAHLRDTGWSPWVVERWIPQARKRLDLWHFGDIIAQKLGERPTIIQTTSGAHVAARVAKIREDPYASEQARIWLASGGRIVVHGWRKVKVKRGGSAMRWQLREVEIVMGDLA